MGLLDQFIGGSQPGGSSNLGVMVAAGAALALAAHAMHQQSTGAAPPGAGGLGGLLGGLLGQQGGGIGQALGAGQGAGLGPLQALLDRLSDRGHGGQVASWLGDGPNQPIQPQEVEHALGDKALTQLQQQTGAPRQTLVSELANALPNVISRLSPNGQLDENALRGLLQNWGPAPH